MQHSSSRVKMSMKNIKQDLVVWIYIKTRSDQLQARLGGLTGGLDQWRTKDFLLGGVQQIRLRTEGRERTGIWGRCPLVRGSAQFVNETHFLIRLLRMYFPQN
jgi:hypothetical protein